jgi:hypothetical protein
VDHYRHRTLAEPVRFGGYVVDHSIDHLYLEEVVPRTQRSQLSTAPIHGTIGDEIRLGALRGAPFFASLQVVIGAESGVDGGPRPLSEHRPDQTALGDSALAQTARDPLVEPPHNAIPVSIEFFLDELRGQ